MVRNFWEFGIVGSAWWEIVFRDVDAGEVFWSVIVRRRRDDFGGGGEGVIGEGCLREGVVGVGVFLASN